nr:hypothetical protein [uncultured Allomuricauda sp.]
MKKYGVEHLKFSRSTYRVRNSLLVVCILAILYFEYNIVDDLTIYNVIIPKAIVELSLYVSLTWLAIQFLFLSIDDYIDWKKVFLISDEAINEFPLEGREVKPNNVTLLLEIESFSKGKIKYRVDDYGVRMYSTGSISTEMVIETLEKSMNNLESSMKNEIKRLERFQKWYKRYSVITFIRFYILEFSLPLLLAIYAGIICHFWPILPK